MNVPVTKRGHIPSVTPTVYTIYMKRTRHAGHNAGQNHKFSAEDAIIGSEFHNTLYAT